MSPSVGRRSTSGDDFLSRLERAEARDRVCCLLPTCNRPRYEDLTAADTVWRVWLGSAYEDYPQALSDQIEERFRAAPGGEAWITLRGQNYRVSFKEMKQVRASDPTKARRVRRVERQSGRDTIHPFCGRTHAAEYQRLYPHGVCQLPGCTAAACFDAAAQRPHAFCCKSHATLSSGLQATAAKAAAPEARPPLVVPTGMAPLPSTVPFVDAVPLGVPIAIESGKRVGAIPMALPI